MSRKFHALAFGCLLIFLLPATAQALLTSKPLATDNRIQTVVYSPNQVYKFVGHYGYEASIEFAADELIQTISIGDSLAWLVSPSANRIFLKPIEQDALTNMTVITNLRTYHFELHPEETDDIRDKNMVFVMRFVYNENDAPLSPVIADRVPDLSDPEERAKLNFNYSLTGSELIAPLRIFDDGQFTYFQFKNKNADVPAFFLVDSQGFESLINFRTRGDYIVVERVASQFTLRHGPDVLCVYNEAMPMKRAEKKGFFSGVTGKK